MSISAGRVVVNGNVVLDSSGTNNIGYLNAVKISADTVSAGTIIATNINYNDLDVSGNITTPIANITTANIGTANITTGVITSLSGTSSNFGTGVITSLSGTSSTFGTGVFGSLDASGASFNVVNSGLLQGSVSIPITGTFNSLGLNSYEGKLQSGDIISYDTVAVLTAAQTNTYMTSLLDYGQTPGTVSGTFWQTTDYNMAVHRISYWANDFLANSIQRQSATLIVPFKGPTNSPTTLPKNSAVVSYKHGTLATTYQNATLWRAMAEAAFNQTFDPMNGSLIIDPVGWMLAATGYVVVCADNVSYGKSVGSYDIANTADESTSQYASIVATTQLMRTTPALFYNQFGSGVTSVNVINSGYSLGGANSACVSQLINNSVVPGTRNPYYNDNPNTIPLKLVQTIAGAPINTYQLFKNTVADNFNSPTLWAVFVFVMLGLGDPQNYLLRNSVRPNIISDVLPVFNQFYANTAANSVSQSTNVQLKAVLSIADAYSRQNNTSGPQAISNTTTIYPYVNAAFSPTNPAAPNTTGYITPNQFYYNPYYSDSSNYNFAINFIKQATFYNNNFIDFSDLSGTPITVIYSTGDELACPNAGAAFLYNDSTPNIYLGTPSKDIIYSPYTSWLSGLNQGKSFIDTSGLLVSNGYATSSPATNPIANVLQATENNNTASIVRVNVDPGNFGTVPQAIQNALLQHTTFSATVFQLGVRTYLNNRS